MGSDAAKPVVIKPTSWKDIAPLTVDLDITPMRRSEPAMVKTHCQVPYLLELDVVSVLLSAGTNCFESFSCKNLHHLNIL